MGRMTDIIGSVLGRYQFGIGGPLFKRDGSTQTIQARTADDSALTDLVVATLQAAGINVTGNDIVLNSDGASGADRKMTLRRPSTGMSADVVIVLPAADPAPGQALTVASFAGGVITLEYTTVAGGTDKMVWDTTTIAFGDASPAAMFSKPANAVVMAVKVVIDTPFDGAPQLSVGIAGTTAKYLPTTAVDLTADAGTVFEWDPGLGPQAAESVIATYSAGGATEGSARVLTGYVIPS